MTANGTHEISEDELDILVSIAIQRAELLDGQALSGARAAWREVLEYETRLAELTDANTVPGGIARAGAVAAALAAGERETAMKLRTTFLADPNLPAERRKVIERAFDEDRVMKDRRYPFLTLRRRSWLEDLSTWRAKAAQQPRVFPSCA